MRKRGKGGAKIEKYLGVKVFLFGFCNHASEMVKSHQKPPMSPLASQPPFSMYELTWCLTYFWYIVCFCFVLKKSCVQADMTWLSSWDFTCSALAWSALRGRHATFHIRWWWTTKIIISQQVIFHKCTWKTMRRMEGSGVEPGLPKNTLYRTWWN